MRTASLALFALLTQPGAQCLVEDLVDPSASASGRFGQAVALSGTTAVVGRPGYPGISSGKGRVHVYELVGKDWVETDVLTSGGFANQDLFGADVDIDGDVAVVGSPGTFVPLANPGAAFVFERQGGVWVQTAKLVVSDFSLPGTTGHGVAVSRDTVLVSVPADSASFTTKGYVYVFVRSHSGWIQTQRLQATGSQDEPYRFATSIDLDGDRAIVGAPGTTASSHAAFVFERGSGPFALAATLAAPVTGSTGFGSSVALHGDTALVGAPAQSSGGEVHVYDRSGGTWSPTASFRATSTSFGDGFGTAVDLEGARIVVGSSGASTSTSKTGAAHVFERTSPTAFVESPLLPPGLAAFDAYGGSVAVAGDTQLVGAETHDAGAPDAGAAWLWSLDPDACPAISASPASISLAAGGTQLIDLHGGSASAGLAYLVLGSVTGVAPGFEFEGVHVPLNSDLYFSHTLANPSSAPLASSFGLLDSGGAATARFDLQAGSDPGLAGLVVHHAWLRIDASIPGIDFASGAVDVMLEP